MRLKCFDAKKSETQMAEKTMKEEQCFVVMPFGGGGEYRGKEKESTFILNHIIEPAVAEAVEAFNSGKLEVEHLSLQVRRELEETSSGNITESIVRKVAGSYITIVDLTGRNPNVFLELRCTICTQEKRDDSSHSRRG